MDKPGRTPTVREGVDKRNPLPDGRGSPGEIRTFRASDGYSFLVEMLFVASAMGNRIAEVPITFVERRRGESKLTSGVLLESAVTPWRLVARRQRSFRAMV